MIENDTLNKLDAAGLKQGYWKKYKENEGKDYLAEEGRYINGRKTGLWIEYYGNGKQKNSIEFKDGKPDGKAIVRFNNGKVSESGIWKSNKWQGDYFLFYECNGNVKQKAHFDQKGKRDGNQKHYYANGNIYIDANFTAAQETGEINYFDFTGRLVGKSNYINGIETESSKKNKTFDIDYLKQQGDSLEKEILNESSSAWQKRAVTTKFLLSGYETTYNKNKQITKEGVFIDNRLIDGKIYSYDAKGQLTRISIYKDEQYIEDEFNANLSEEEKAQKTLLNKLKSIDEELSSMKMLIFAKQKEVDQKDDQLKEQTLQNQVLEKEKQIKELLLEQQNNTLKVKETESLKKELLITTLNKDKRIRTIELKNQKAENEKKAQALQLIVKQRKFQEAEIKQQKFIKNIISMGLMLVAFFSVFMIISLIKNKKANKIISKQKVEVENQKHLVEEKNREITDSINYAQRIQSSLLANEALLKTNLPEHFIYFQPKDIVSGDFYWAASVKAPMANGSTSNKISADNGAVLNTATKFTGSTSINSSSDNDAITDRVLEPKNQKNLFILVTADSTGHGVPGAIMSMLNISCLKEAVENKNLIEPSDILNHTRTMVIKTLANDGSTEGGKEGMDCNIIRFDIENYRLTYAAANNPLWIVRCNPVYNAGDPSQVGMELIELVPDKMPVGKHDKDLMPFSQHDFSLLKDDMIYTFTDGYPDQFGGPKGKKFMHKKLKGLLIEISSKPLAQQHILLKNKFDEWKGADEQVDDVTIIGIRIK